MWVVPVVSLLLLRCLLLCLFRRCLPPCRQCAKEWMDPLWWWLLRWLLPMVAGYCR